MNASKSLLLLLVAGLSVALVVLFTSDGRRGGREFEPGRENRGAGSLASGVELASSSEVLDAAGRESNEVDEATSAGESGAPEIPDEVLRRFTEVRLDKFERESWNRRRFLEWGCDRAPSVAPMLDALELRLTGVPMHIQKKIDAAGPEVVERARAVEARFLEQHEGLIEETRELVALRVEEASVPESVRTFHGLDELESAIPLCTIRTWGYVKGWVHEGEYALVRFDAADDAVLRANFDTMDMFRRVRDSDLLSLVDG